MAHTLIMSKAYKPGARLIFFDAGIFYKPGKEQGSRL